MEKTFDLKAIANRNLIIRGLLIKPNKLFEIRICENDFNNIKPYIDIIKCEPTVADNQKPNSVVKNAVDDSRNIEVEEKQEIAETEIKEKKRNDKPRVYANSRNKVQATK